MATYGDFTVGVTKLNTTTATGTLYTVPASTRAKVKFSYINTSTATVTIGTQLTLTGTVSFPSESGTLVSLDLLLASEIWLNAGDTISATGSAADIEAVIEEYSNP